MYSVRALLSYLLLLSASFVFAQSKLDSIQYLNEVTVTTNRYKEIIPAQTLKGEQLEMMGTLSVTDAIRYFSGVQIKDYGGIGGIKTVNIRSMGTNHMGVYYNGIQLGNAQNGQIDLGKFSLDNIEEISLYNGQKSEIFQSAKEFGSAGSIYLTTRRPRFKGDKNTNLRATLRTGSFDLINGSILYEYKIDDNISTTFNAEWINASGKYKFRYRRVAPTGELAYDTTAVRQNGDIDAKRMEGSVQGSLSRGFWKVYLYHYSSERGVPGAIVNNVWRRGERLWDRNSFIQGTYTQEINDKLDTKVNVKYAFDYTRYVNNDDKLIAVDNIYKQREIYLSWSNRYSILSNWEASAAYDIQWNDLSEFTDVSRTTHWLSLATAFSVAQRLKVQASILGSLINEEARGRDSIPNTTKFTPAVFLSYQPFRHHELVFRAFYKQSYRMPTFNDLYYTDMGNAALKPEWVTQYNVGIVYEVSPSKLLRNVRVGVDAYYNYVKDKIVAYPKGQQFRWTMLNLGKVDIRGIDASLMTTFALPQKLLVTTKFQYTYQKAIDITKKSDNYYRHQIPYIPHHSGSLTTMFSWKSWRANYSFIYVGERYNQQENIRYNYTQPWYTHDISIVKDIKLKKIDIRLTAEVNNLLSQDYDVILNYPMPKRNFKFGITVNL